MPVPPRLIPPPGLGSGNAGHAVAAHALREGNEGLHVRRNARLVAGRAASGNRERADDRRKHYQYVQALQVDHGSRLQRTANNTDVNALTLPI